MMMTYAAPFAFGCFMLAIVLNIVRLITAPSIGDRILAVDTMVTNSIALLVLGGFLLGKPVYDESALVLAATGFIGTVILCRYLLAEGVE